MFLFHIENKGFRDDNIYYTIKESLESKEFSETFEKSDKSLKSIRKLIEGLLSSLQGEVLSDSDFYNLQDCLMEEFSDDYSKVNDLTFMFGSE